MTRGGRCFQAAADHTLLVRSKQVDACCPILDRPEMTEHNGSAPTNKISPRTGSTPWRGILLALLCALAFGLSQGGAEAQAGGDPGVGADGGARTCRSGPQWHACRSVAAPDLNGAFRELDCLITYRRSSRVQGTAFDKLIFRKFRGLYRRVLGHKIDRKTVGRWKLLYQLGTRLYPLKNRWAANATIPVYEVNGHHHAVPYWLKESRRRKLGPLFHVDTHDDMAQIPSPHQVLRAVRDIKANRKVPKAWHTIAHAVSHCSMPVTAAVLIGTHRNVIWAKPAEDLMFPELLNRTFFCAVPKKGIPAVAFVPGVRPGDGHDLKDQMEDARRKRNHVWIFYDHRMEPRRSPAPWNYAWSKVAAVHRPIRKKLDLITPFRLSIVNTRESGSLRGPAFRARALRRILRAMPRGKFTLDLDLDYFASVDMARGFRRRSGSRPRYSPNSFVWRRKVLAKRIATFKVLLEGMRDKGRTPALITIADSTFLAFALDREAQGQPEFTPIEHSAFIRSRVRRMLREVYGRKVFNGRPQPLQTLVSAADRKDLAEGRSAGSSLAAFDSPPSGATVLPQIGPLPAFRSRHNPEAICLLREAMKRSHSVASRGSIRTGRMVISGLYWLTRHIEENANFDEMFPEFVGTLARLTGYLRQTGVSHIADRMVRSAFRRARPHLGEIFDRTPEGQRRFISIIPLLYRYKVPLAPFLRFYSARFPGGPRVGLPSTISTAVAERDYGSLLSHLRLENGLAAIKKKEHRRRFRLPADRRDLLFGKLARLPLSPAVGPGPDEGPERIRLIAELILALGRPGPAVPGRSRLFRRLRLALKSGLEAIPRAHAKSSVLTARVVQALASAGRGTRLQAKNGVLGLLRFRRRDGSWGRKGRRRGRGSGEATLAAVEAVAHASGQKGLLPDAVAGRVGLSTRSAWVRVSSCVLATGLPPAFASRHNPRAACLIRKAILRASTRAARARLAGLHWMVGFVERDTNFRGVFADYLMGLDRLVREGGPRPVPYIARLLLRNAFRRAGPELARYFLRSSDGRRQLISILPLLSRYRIPREAFLRLYRTHFPRMLRTAARGAFSKAMRDGDYEAMSDLLLAEASLQELAHPDPKGRLSLRPSRLGKYLGQLKGFRMEDTLDRDLDAYVDQSYFAAVLASVLSRDGAVRAPSTKQVARLKAYLLRELPTIRRELAEVDLLADAVRGAKLLGLARSRQVRRAEERLLLLQHADGSWGTDADFKGRTLFAVLRPTLAAVGALSPIPRQSDGPGGGKAATTRPTTRPGWWAGGACGTSSGLPPSFTSRHSPEAVCCLRRGLTRSRSKVGRAILMGMHWMAQYVEKSANFNSAFEQYVGVLDHLVRHGGKTAVGINARRLLKDALRRARPRLGDIFGPGRGNHWRFINVLGILQRHGIDRPFYLKFYRRRYPAPMFRIGSGTQELQKLVKRRSYRVIGDMLSDEAALAAASIGAAGNPFALPRSRLEAYLGRLVRLPFVGRFRRNQGKYTRQSFLVTSLARILGRKGGTVIKQTRLSRRLRAYLLRELSTIRRRVRDIDLLSETVEALGILGRGKLPAVREAAGHLLSLQHTDGSWGTDADFLRTAPYQVILPTCAALRALSHGYGSAHKPRTGKPGARTPARGATPSAGDSCRLPRRIPPAFRSKHNPREIRMLRKAILKTSSRVERAILAGMHWLVWVMEDDVKFKEGFGDYTAMMNELAIYGRGSTPGRIAARLLENAFVRSKDRLPRIFESTMAGKGDFITVLYTLYKLDIPKGPFIRFYRAHFPKGKPKPHQMSFLEAAKKLNYEVLGTHLIDDALLEVFQLKHPRNPYNLRKSNLAAYLRRLESLPFVHTKKNLNAFSAQNYFVTQIVLAINRYGEVPFPDNGLTRRVLMYLNRHMATVRYEDKDLDLLAAYVYCFKVYGLANRPDVKEAVKYMLDLQHADGSWGTDADFAGTLYQVMHPTWAVLTGLADIAGPRGTATSQPARRR